jgi:2-aminoethylphosphonate dioxygenase
MSLSLSLPPPPLSLCLSLSLAIFFPLALSSLFSPPPPLFPLFFPLFFPFSFFCFASSATMDKLTDAQVKSFEQDGCLVIPAADFWTDDELKSLLNGVNEMDSWEDAPGKYMKYYEVVKTESASDSKTTEKKLLQRIENFLQYNPAIDKLVNGERMLKCVSQLFGEDSILYKEKINYKLPGGDGFKPHQDHAAGWWMYGQTLHISCLIGVDPADETNGALEIVRGKHKDGLLSPEWTELPADVCETFTWEMVKTNLGDVVFFDSFVPHASGPNKSDKSRRILYTTYAKKSEGDLRERYYADKRKSFPPDCEREDGKEYHYKI